MPPWGDEHIDKPRRVRHEYHGKSGTVGPDGPKAPAALGAEAGAVGSVSVGQDLDMPLFGMQLSLLLAKMVLRRAKINHLNGNLEEAAESLIWLHRMLSPTTPRADSTSLIVDQESSGEETRPDYDFEKIRRQTGIQIRRLQLGFDAYGNAMTFIPMTSYNAYSEYLSRWLDAAGVAEQNYEKYEQQYISQDLALRDARTNLAFLDTAIVNLQQDIEASGSHRTILQSEILGLLGDVQKAAHELNNASQAFRDAVSSQTNNCEFGDIVKAAGSIVAMTQGGYAAVAAVGPLFDAISNEDNEDTFEYLKTIAKKVAVVKGNVGEISGAYNELKGILKGHTSPDLPSDHAKILTHRDEIEESIEAYKHLPEAGQYLQAMDNFISLSFARNQKIVEHDALILQEIEARTSIDQAEWDIQLIRSKLAVTQNPYLAELTQFMEEGLDFYKTELVRGLHYAKRAFEYLTLESGNTVLERTTVSHLKAAYHTLDRRLQHANERRGRLHQTIELGSPITRFSLKQLIGENGMMELCSGKRIGFVIPKEAFSDFHHVYATRVKVEFEGLGAGISGTLGVRLLHRGLALFNGAGGDQYQFTHAPRGTILYGADGDGASLGGNNEEFISLTPQGPWRVDVDLNRNSGFDFSNLKDVWLSFEIKFLPNV